MELRELQCLKCGGQLDSGESGQRLCPYCGARFLLAAGTFRELQSYVVPVTVTNEALIDRAKKRLRGSGMKQVPELEVCRESVRYLMRRGRARISPESSGALTRSSAESHESVKEGLFGIPLSGEQDLALVFFEDTGALEPGDGKVPDGIDDELLAFDDRLEKALIVEFEANKKREMGYAFAWAGFDVSLNWHDDIYLLEIPMVVLRFSWAGEKAPMLQRWEGTNRQGTYDIAYNGHDGALLRWNAPRRTVRMDQIALLVILVVFVLPAILGAGMSVFGFCASIALSLVMALIPALLGA